jgi:glycosyltransferase involved in cell wall biosynthesis/HEAT repeat protein
MPDITEAPSRISHVLNTIESFDPNIPQEEELLSLITDEEELHELALLASKGTFKVKYFVIRHLGKFDCESAILDLIEFIYEENEILHNEAERVLLAMESDRKYQLFLPLLASKHRMAQLFAIRAMGKGERVNSVLPLMAILEGGDEEAKYYAIDALRMIGDPRADRAVIARLSDEAPKVRYAAAFYCGSRKTVSACRSLAALLSDHSGRIRFITAWALGQIPGNECNHQLASLYSSEKDRNVRNEIMRVLTKKSSLDLLTGADKTCIGEPGETGCVSDWYFTYVLGEKKEEKTDICLLVEGSYPFVAGGVSSWVQDLLKYFHELTFSIIRISTSASEIREFKYDLPPNVRYFGEIDLYDLPRLTPHRKDDHDKRRKLFEQIEKFLQTLKKVDKGDFIALCNELGAPGELNVSLSDLLFSREAWEFIKSVYRSHLGDLPFLEYNWSYRAIMLPLYNLLKARLPESRIYYSALTGYAGLAAALARIHFGSPFLLTEHGIYHRERMFEINRSGWIYQKEEEGYRVKDMIVGLKRIWFDMYFSLSSIAYRFADRITTLHRDNSLMQIEAGAEPEKIAIIPNGIDAEAFRPIAEVKKPHSIFTVALIGRVVSIKDIKTFIRAARLVYDHTGPTVTFKILGPYDEEPDYADECFALVNLLGLEMAMEFTGNVNLKEYLKRVDIVVLTSISEGQPLSLMEAMASGIPSVATNVGSCRELLTGRSDEDRRLGRCGTITDVHSPYETAQAITEIMENPRLYAGMARAGVERIKKYYDRKDIYEEYRKEFNRLFEMTGKPADGAGQSSAAPAKP